MAWLERLALVLGSLIVVAGSFVAVELALAAWSDVPTLGNSANLFQYRAYGDSLGNQPLVRGWSFGAPVYTDQHGFRAAAPVPVAPKKPALLILGDSVAFGPGVLESETFAGRLRALHPDWAVLNASVIGHAAHDYLTVAKHLLPQHPEVRAVWVFWCLNDLSTVSAAAMQRELAGPRASGEAPPPSPNPVSRAGPAAPPPTGWVEALREVGWVSAVNESLRARSRLYVLFRTWVTNPQRRHFDADVALYRSEDFDQAVSPLVALKDLVERRGASFRVFLVPYAVQLSSRAPEDLLPQRRLGSFLSQHFIPYRDLTPEFARIKRADRRLFLFGDAMHLSEEGHAAVAAWIASEVRP